MTDCDHSTAEALACQVLEDAVEEQHVVTFKYKKANGAVSTRTISPYEVSGDITESNLKVLGWDHDREGIRSFNIDHTKLSDVEPAPATDFVPPTS